MTDTTNYQKNLPQKIEFLKEGHVEPNFKNQISSALKDENDNNISVNVSYPPHMLVDNSEETPDKIKKKLVESYIQRTTRTSMRVNFCTLTHKSLEEELLEGYRLPSFYHTIEDAYYKYILGVFQYDPKHKHRNYHKICFYIYQNPVLSVK